MVRVVIFLQHFVVVRGVEISSSFGKLLRKLRLSKELTQESLAEMADVHPTYISLLERGERVPGIDVAERIARAIGLKLSQMIAQAERMDAKSRLKGE